MSIQQELQHFSEDVLLLGLKYILYFRVFYISFSNKLILIVIFNNWGNRLNFQIGFTGVKVEVVVLPTRKTNSDPESSKDEKKDEK